MPALTLPMSVSSISARICTALRSAIDISNVPPAKSWVGDEMTWPFSTGFMITVPVTGARISVSSTAMRAFSTSTSADTTSASAFASSSAACS